MPRFIGCLDSLDPSIHWTPRFIGCLDSLDASIHWMFQIIRCLDSLDVSIHWMPRFIGDKLHWLPIQQRIKLKIGVLVYRCIHRTAPPYLSEMLSAAADIAGRRSLRSAAHGDLGVPRSRTVRFSSQMFAVSGPRFWNSLTNELKNSSLTEPAFKKTVENVPVQNCLVCFDAPP